MMFGLPFFFRSLLVLGLLLTAMLCLPSPDAMAQGTLAANVAVIEGGMQGAEPLMARCTGDETPETSVQADDPCCEDALTLPDSLASIARHGVDRVQLGDLASSFSYSAIPALRPPDA